MFDRGLAAALGVALMIVLPTAGAAQVGEPEPLPSDVAGLQAALDDVTTRLDAIGQAIAARNQARTNERLEATRERLDSTRIGPIRLVAFREDLPVATQMVAQAWADHDAHLGRHADWLSNVRMVAQPDRSESIVMNYDPNLADIPFWVGSNITEPHLTSLRDAMNRLLRRPTEVAGPDEKYDRRFGSWVGTSLDANASTQSVWFDLIRSKSPAGGACIEGNISSCLVVLNLYPDEGDEPVNRFDRIAAWLGLESADDVVGYIRAVERRNPDPWREPMTDAVEEFLLACNDDMSARMDSNPEWSCASAMQSYEWRVSDEIGGRAIYSARQSLLHYAFTVAPDGGFERIAEAVGSNSSEQQVLEVLAGMPVERLVSDWWAARLGEYRPDSGGPGSTSAPGAVFWAGFFVLFSFLSTRRRFG